MMDCGRETCNSNQWCETFYAGDQFDGKQCTNCLPCEKGLNEVVPCGPNHPTICCKSPFNTAFFNKITEQFMCSENVNTAEPDTHTLEIVMPITLVFFILICVILVWKKRDVVKNWMKRKCHFKNPVIDNTVDIENQNKNEQEKMDMIYKTPSSVCTHNTTILTVITTRASQKFPLLCQHPDETISNRRESIDDLHCTLLQNPIYNTQRDSNCNTHMLFPLKLKGNSSSSQ